MSKKTFKATFRVISWFETEIVAANISEARGLAHSIAEDQQANSRTIDNAIVDVQVADVELVGGPRGVDHED